MGLVEAIFSRQIGGSKDTFLQSHPYHISDDDIAKNDESFLLSFLMLRFSFLYSQAQYDSWPDLNKSQMARPKTPTTSKVSCIFDGSLKSKDVNKGTDEIRNFGHKVINCKIFNKN